MRFESHASKMSGTVVLVVTLWSVLPGPVARAAEVAVLPPAVGDSNAPWQLLAGCLVFLMPAGLAMLATGLTRAKNASHTAFLTFFGCALAIVSFWLAGFAVARGGSGFLLRHLGNDPRSFGSFFGQVAALCVVTSIPVGAMAERWSLRSFYYPVLFMSLILFPLFTLWTWGGGWLARLGYVDVAGSGVIHGVGGLFALAGASVLGPRIGRYHRNGTVAPIPAHNIPLTFLGCFLLLVGWLGLNVSHAPESAALVAAVTILAGAGGAVAAASFMIATTRKPDPTITMNGLLAGLVSSSAGVGCTSPTAAVIISIVAGLLVCMTVQWFDKWRIDDPVGAISVHGVGGLWGVLAVGIFANSDSVKGCLHGGWGQLGAQVMGCVVLLLWAGGLSWVFLKIADKFIPMRVVPEIELDGLDVSETGLLGYPDFHVVSPHTSGFSGSVMRLTSTRDYEHEKN
jgi:ammonium transporter, Amt family